MPQLTADQSDAVAQLLDSLSDAIRAGQGQVAADLCDAWAATLRATAPVQPKPWEH